MPRLKMTPDQAQSKARTDFQLAVKLQRVRFDMSQKELGQAVGISAPQMSELLSDPDKISVARLRSIVRALDMDPVTILRLLGFSDKAIRSLGREMEAAAPAAPIPLRKYQ